MPKPTKKPPHKFTIRTEIPADVPPSLVLSTLRGDGGGGRLTCLLEHHPTVYSFQKVHENLSNSDRGALFSSFSAVSHNDDGEEDKSRRRRRRSTSSSTTTPSQPTTFSTYDLWEGRIGIATIPFLPDRFRFHRLRAFGYFHHHRQAGDEETLVGCDDDDDEIGSVRGGGSVIFVVRKTNKYGLTATLRGELNIVRRGGNKEDDAFQGDGPVVVMPIPPPNNNNNSDDNRNEGNNEGETEWDLLGEFEVEDSWLLRLLGMKAIKRNLDHMLEGVLEEAGGERDWM